MQSSAASSKELKRWWPTAEAASLFSVPPFPGSKAEPLARRTPGLSQPLPDQEANACVSAMASLRAGGTFWEGQPQLPAATFILAKPGSAAQLKIMTDMADEQAVPVLFWLPDRGAVSPSFAPAHVIFGACDPWHLLSGAHQVWVDRLDELSIIAAVAAVPQVLFGGNSGPRVVNEVNPNTSLVALVHDVQFHDPFSGALASLLQVIETLGFWRQLIDGNRAISAVYGVAFWKRSSIAPMIWNGSTAVRFETRFSPGAEAGSNASAAWIARTPTVILQRLAANDLPMFQIEDGFIRSVGLGADCVPPLSIVVDPHGAHYDPAQRSGLELLLSTHDFTVQTLDRARRLREVIVSQGISKYGADKGTALRLGGDRRHLLVTGQVEDDQSVIKGGGGITSNLELLRRVRDVEPEAFIIYRPHPDVDAGHRKGYIGDDVALTLADSIAREDAITSLIDIADEVHVLTSLAGFEALMRGKSVTTHGVPFYAGWGLTNDLGPVPKRRERRRSLDELVAATLLLYPRYLDPITRLPCPPEVLIERLSAGGGKDGLLVSTRRAWGRTMGALRNLSVQFSPGVTAR